ncbi:hypothetical protein O181_010575 [Austropuccinia psidii MF-1]|uniref:Stc1 domain-containing protein n=1 Tax=Austropuccinia psidii MF-1 TaxID=1389203 RepID=A0A9Q3GL17_9BASI|nr:hypothetical protein [Austropuccinia psidii MF-1]
MPADRPQRDTTTEKRIFCTGCKIIKDQDQFDGSQLKKRFGSKLTLSKDFKLGYNAEDERLKLLEKDKVLQKIWCISCIPKLIEEFFCSGCEEMLPRSHFAQAQLSKHVLDDDRLCRVCAGLTMEKIEAIRVGEHFKADKIESQLDQRRGARSTLKEKRVDDDDDE